MSWLNLVSVFLVLAGLFLFLYAANVYNVPVGWAGFSLGLLGLSFFVVTYVYAQLKKKEPETVIF